jgi:hypothetical protein
LNRTLNAIRSDDDATTALKEYDRQNLLEKPISQEVKSLDDIFALDDDILAADADEYFVQKFARPPSAKPDKVSERQRTDTIMVRKMFLNIYLEPCMTRQAIPIPDNQVCTHPGREVDCSTKTITLVKARETDPGANFVKDLDQGIIIASGIRFDTGPKAGRAIAWLRLK